MNENRKIASTLIGHVCFLFLVNTLYKLFKPFNGDMARVMVLFVVAGVSVASINSLSQFASILILNGSGSLSAFETSQLHALAMMFLIPVWILYCSNILGALASFIEVGSEVSFLLWLLIKVQKKPAVNRCPKKCCHAIEYK